jgi:hypothetical protein
MLPETVKSPYDEFVIYFVEKARPEEILAFQVSDAAQERARDLSERNQEDDLTPEEMFELKQMVEFDQMMGVLKTRALLALKSNAT